MSPISLGFQVPQEEFRRQTKLDASHAVGDLPCDELVAAARALMIEQNAVAAGDVVGFTVVEGKIEAGHFTDPIRTSRMERGGLALRRLTNLAEHFARPGEIETARRLHLA